MTLLFEPTNKELAAIKALREVGSFDRASRAFAESAQPMMLKEIKRASLKIAKRPCLKRLINMADACRCGIDDEKHQPCGIGVDHPYLLTSKGRPSAYAYHPYLLGEAQLKKLAELCEEYGLVVTISADRSWYFPSRTLAVILTRGDEKSGWTGRNNLLDR